MYRTTHKVKKIKFFNEINPSVLTPKSFIISLLKDLDTSILIDLFNDLENVFGCGAKF